MPNIPRTRIKCDKCNVKIPKMQPKLRCSICDSIKHLACQKLTKSDANQIIRLKLNWTCTECISDILPINACIPAKIVKSERPTRFKVKCSACNGFCYSAHNVRICDYCNNKVHVKCWRNDLGCTKCCENIIPGFYVYSYELIGDPYYKNNKMYNPYDSSHFTQLIGDMLSEDAESNSAFREASELLVNCKYKISGKVDVPSNLELSIFSLNISTLGNKIDILRENISFYGNFDVLLFNETNCIVDKLVNGESDLELEGFYKPIIKDPIRKSGKGGGLSIYINKRVCAEEDNIEIFCPYSDTENTSGEFQFIKIKNCKEHQKTVILGNVYRSPSSTPTKFNIYFDKILEKLNNKRYSNKLIYIVGDFNQDLIKYENDINCQNLVDRAHTNGFIQLVSRPTRITGRTATYLY